MPIISKLSDECKKCSYVNNCNDKRMVACTFKEMPKNLSSNCIAPLTSTLSLPMAKLYTPVTIKMGEYGNINTSLEEIRERIANDFNKKIFNLNCYFNKS